MARKKLNKNVIAGLTVGAMFVFVAVVAVGSAAISRKDPKILAAKAADFEKSGDLESAARTFFRAYTIDKEAKYLVDSSRCLYNLGVIGDALDKLRQAQVAAPNDPAILKAALERYWELRLYGFGANVWDPMKEYATNLLKVEPDSLLAHACLADALFGRRDREAGNLAKSEEHLKRAEALDAADPVVAIVAADHRVDLEMEKAKSLSPDEFRRKAREVQSAVAESLKKSVEAHPQDLQVALKLAGVERYLGNTDEARKILERAIREIPGAFEPRASLAGLLLAGLDGMKDASKEQRLKVIDEGLKYIDQALTMEPAAFVNYGVKAELLERKFQDDGSWKASPAEKAKEVLDTFIRGENDTNLLKSKTAALFSRLRISMLLQGFSIAQRFATAPETRAVALEYAGKLAAAMRSRFPTLEHGPAMEGWLAQVKGDTTRAIQLYKEAEAASGGSTSQSTLYAREQLATLLENEAPGAALKYADDCIRSYAALGAAPPRRLLLLKVKLLISTNQAQDALHFIELLERSMPDDKGLLVYKVQAMQILKLPGADELMKRLGDTPAAMLQRARLTALSGDMKSAAAQLRTYLSGNDLNMDAVQMYAMCVAKTDGRDEGATFIASLLPKAASESAKLQLETLRLFVAEPDAAKRDEKLLALIQALPDECARTTSLLDFFLARNNFEEAAAQLPALEKCLGADAPDFMLIAFQLSIVTGKLDAAEKYSLKLTQLNADRANGATFRGELARARGKFDDALREFKLAQRDLPTDSRVKIRIAELLMRSTPPQTDEAIAILKQGIENDPRDFDLNRLLYLCYEQSGRQAEGMPYLVAAQQVNPANEFVQKRIKLIEEANDPAKGVEWREQLRKNPPADPKQVVDNLVRLADDYERLKQFDKADECMTAAMAAAPTSEVVAYSAARLYGNRTGDATIDSAARQKGEDFLRQYINAVDGPSRLDGKMLLGKFFESRGDQAAAVAAYLDAERNVEPWLKDHPELINRAKVLVNVTLAEYYSRRGRPADAVEAYRSAAGLIKPEEAAKSQDIRLKLIQALLANQQFGDAAKMLDAYEKDFPGDTRAKAVRAQALLRQSYDEKSINSAIALYTAAIAGNPNDLASLYMRARLYGNQRRFNDARDDLLKIKAMNPSAFNYGAWRELAKVYENMQNVDLARNEWTELMNARRADSPEAGRAAAEELIDFLKRIDRPKDAEAELNKLIARDPKDWHWPLELGDLLVERKEYSAAVTQLNAAMDLTRAGEPEVIISWLDALSDGGRAAEAISGLPRLKETSLTPKVRASMAGAYVRVKDKASATRLLREALIDAANERVDTADYVFNRAAKYLGVNEAVTLLRECVKSVAADNPDSAIKLDTILARVLVALPDEAARKEGIALADHVAASSNAKTKINTTARIAKASGLDAGGDVDGAIAVYESVIRDTPDNATALNNLAYLLVDRKNKPAEALPYAERAGQIAPNDANILDTVGTVQMANGNLGQAEAALREAIRLNPRGVAATFHLGQVCAKANRSSEARQFFDRVLELTSGDPNHAYRKRAEEEKAKLK